MNPDKDIRSMFLRTEETICPPSSLGSGLALSSLAPAWCGGEGLADTVCIEDSSSQARAVDFMPGKSGLLARGEGERVIALESWEGTRASRRVEVGFST